jgi:amidophosphoribosyltransferase
MPSRNELVAHGRNEVEIAKTIGADLVVFQSLPDLVESVRHLNTNISTFDCSVFTGDYITGGVSEEYLRFIEGLRSDNNRVRLNLDTNVLQSDAVNGHPNGHVAESNPSSSTAGLDDTVGLHNSWKSN